MAAVESPIKQEGAGEDDFAQAQEDAYGLIKQQKKHQPDSGYIGQLRQQ